MTRNKFFKEIKAQWKAKLPFVIYNKPDEKIFSGILQENNKLYSDLDFSVSGFVFSPFVNNVHKSIWFPEKNTKTISSQINAEFKFENQDSNQYDINKTAKNQHLQILKLALSQLESGALNKVVISRKELVQISIQQPIEWFQQMCVLYPNTFCYCWYHPKVGMWLGATPETLISLKNNSFDTMALAGTMPYSGTTTINWGAKEIEEQQMVTDSITRALQPITSNLKIGETKTHRAGSLLHLKTKISGTLNNSDQLKELVEILHPTSAVCGLPKEAAKKFILANENYDREYYTGYLGTYSTTKNTHLYVNLRCMKIKDQVANIYIGGGITAASNIEKEWEETVNKSQIMKKVL